MSRSVLLCNVCVCYVYILKMSTKKKKKKKNQICLSYSYLSEIDFSFDKFHYLRIVIFKLKYMQ